MKTPAQITEEVAEQMVAKHGLLRESGESARNSLAWELVTGDTLIVEHALEELVARAIEADRAQRAGIDADWIDDQESVRDADHVSVSWTAHDSRGRNTFQSDIVITPGQAVGMFQGIGEAS